MTDNRRQRAENRKQMSEDRFNYPNIDYAWVDRIERYRLRLTIWYHSLHPTCNKLEMSQLFWFEDILASQKIYAIVYDCSFIAVIYNLSKLYVAQPNMQKLKT